MLHVRLDLLRAAWCSTLGLVLGSGCGPAGPALAGVDPASGSTIARSFAAELVAARRPAAGWTEDPTLEAHGVLTTATLHELRRRALDELVAPIAEALLRPFAPALAA